MDRIVQEVLFTDSECQSLIDGVTEWTSATLVQKGQGTEINYGYSDDSHRKASEGKYCLWLSCATSGWWEFPGSCVSSGWYVRWEVVRKSAPLHQVLCCMWPRSTAILRP